MERKAYLIDISDEESGFVAPYLTLITEETPQRDYERLPETLRHFLAMTILLAKPVIDSCSSSMNPTIVTIT